jgi:AraC-like DNA-binding protein
MGQGRKPLPDVVGAIARSLGYESESAFSTAFKRVMGSTPRYHARLAALA